MRDIGFDFYWYDPMAENLFAAGFEAPSAIAFEGVTCFECFEHFTDPRAELETMSSRAPRIVFSTELRPRSIPDQESWSYYGWEHGQHVGFHTQKSLGILGAAFGLQLVSSGAWLHAFLPQGEAESPAARLIRRGKLPLSAWQGKGMRALFRANTFARSLGRGRVISRDFVHPLRNVLGSKTDSDQRRMQSMAKRANP